MVYMIVLLFDSYHGVFYACVFWTIHAICHLQISTEESNQWI